MTAGLSASCLDIKDDVIRRALADFEAVEHHLEFVRTVNGITYINDSKATNVNACYYALESMTSPVVLILGGKDKGNDYEELMEFVSTKVRAIVCLGADNTKLLNFFKGEVPVLTETAQHEGLPCQVHRTGTRGRHRAAFAMLRQFRPLPQYGGPWRAIQGRRKSD